MIVNVTDTTATISWLPPDPPNGIITQYHVEYRSDTSGFMLLQPSNVDMIRTVTGLSSNTQYMFRVTAFTVEGNGPVSKIVVVHTSKRYIILYDTIIVCTCILSSIILTLLSCLYTHT